MLRAAWQSLLELLYPYRCPLCSTIVESRPQLCTACQDIFDIRFVDTRVVEGGHLDVLVFITHYKRVRKALHAAKFEGDTKGLQVLSESLAVAWGQEHSVMLGTVYGLDLADCCCVIVPTDYKRRLQRGYDIPELLFAAWMRKHDLRYRNILRRIKFTQPQFELNRQQRRENVLNSVEVITDVRGKNIILLDDIFTTGASMNEAARALRLQGAKSITAIAFASDLD